MLKTILPKSLIFICHPSPSLYHVLIQRVWGDRWGDRCFGDEKMGIENQVVG